ncbi:MAG: N-acetylmannosamine-6-phosphate 2-epimerase [Clostridiaceae bacterium]|jgi:N-acylglucosamine-6-phosphate 2-epimerase|nr:N-acetylmannosamine-6-phosphate 2-epimerase [Clostridiaceae bacterium]
MDIIRRLKNKVVVSVQAMPSEPLYAEVCINALMKSVIKGGAGALRVAGSRDVKNAKKLFDVPVIGLTKPEVIPQNFKEIVYITPTLKQVVELIEAGADVVAFDGTPRPRPEGCTLKEIIKHISINDRISMADISTLEEGLNCAELGVDILSTTLSGYTTQSPMLSDKPDFKLLEDLVKNTDLPVILEGRIWEPEEVDKAFELGAHAVVIGSAITRPQLITKRFVQRKK